MTTGHETDWAFKNVPPDSGCPGCARLRAELAAARESDDKNQDRVMRLHTDLVQNRKAYEIATMDVLRLSAELATARRALVEAEFALRYARGFDCDGATYSRCCAAGSKVIAEAAKEGGK